MPLPPPQMAHTETLLVKAIRKFHENLVWRLAITRSPTLRAAAWQLDALIEENQKFKDSEYLKTMLKTIEWLVQKKSNTKWTLKRAKLDLRGRTTGVNQHRNKKMPTRRYVAVPPSLKDSLEQRLLAKQSRDPQR